MTLCIEKSDVSLCVWLCLAIHYRVQERKSDPANRRTKAALGLAQQFYGGNSLKSKNIQATNLVDFAGITINFHISMQVFECEGKRTVGINIW